MSRTNHKSKETLLPIADNERNGLFISLGKEASNHARISNILSTNLAARKQPTLFDDLDEENRNTLQISDKKNYVDRKGKPIRLNVEQTKLLKYISSCIPFEHDEIKANIAIINTINAKGEFSSNDTLTPVQIPIVIMNACKEIIGTAKEKDIITMGERLLNLSQIEQVQTFKVGDGEYKVVRPLIILNEKIFKKYSEIRSTKGRKKEEASTEEKDLLIGANVIVGSLLLYEAQNKYCPLFKDKYYLVCKKNKTELFQILLSDLESKWRQYYINCNKAEGEYKKSNGSLLKTNKEEYYKGLGLAKKNALTYKCSLATLRDRLTTDYETSRKMQKQFLKDVEKAISSCADYGIITDKSHVSSDGQNLILVYNPKFNDTEIEEAEAEEV